jgi:hypothetical protein
MAPRTAINLAFAVVAGCGSSADYELVISTSRIADPL